MFKTIRGLFYAHTMCNVCNDYAIKSATEDYIKMMIKGCEKIKVCLHKDGPFPTEYYFVVNDTDKYSLIIINFIVLAIPYLKRGWSKRIEKIYAEMQAED